MLHPTQLLIIDAQNDFCDLPPSLCPVDPATGQPLAPTLPVAGAHADLQRLAGFIQRQQAQIGAITLTLDAHHHIDIAHPPFWRTGAGGAVAPFTPITAAQVRAGDFKPADPKALPRVLAYLDTLEANQRYSLMVWPVHCQIGSWGQGLHADVLAACNAWERAHLQPVQAITKGSNPWTEHYSALQAEVPDVADPATALNTALLRRLDSAQTLLIAGQASSHCVRATVEHLVAHLPSGRPQRLVLLTDCMSPVAGFAPQASAFLQAMQAQGVRLMTQDQALLH